MNFDKNVKEYSDECSERNKNKEVVFAADPPADNSKCKRYSTAKYDRRTRQKIREKIRLENFVFEQLRLLYNTEMIMIVTLIWMKFVHFRQTKKKFSSLKKSLGRVLRSKIKSTYEFIENLLQKLRSTS
ncbi:unnamed protein product [Trichobilharzia szidati]|nr:unnamed protein product [Trichobilharzia szidati]